MSSVLVIIPARTGSKGILNKNWKPLCGCSPHDRALQVAIDAGITDIVTTTDRTDGVDARWLGLIFAYHHRILYAPAPLHTDGCSMQAIVEDVLARIPGPPDQMILLLQPTQPLREVKHLKFAMDRLDIEGRGSVISVVETESPEKLCCIREHRLWPWGWQLIERRQDTVAAYRRDGTVYAWYRKDGYLPSPWWPLVIPSSESSPLDTPFDWQMAEMRLKARG
mgnify:FL=1